MDVSEMQIYRFEDVSVDISRGCLVCGNEERHLRRKTFQVLVYLLEQRGRLVTKNELMKNVWKDTAVTDDVLVQCVKEIRRALGDDSHNPRFIKTVPKAGYRFISPIESLSNGANFYHTEEITRIELEYEEEISDAETREHGDKEKLSEIPIAGFFSSKRRFPPTASLIIVPALILVSLTAAWLVYFWRGGATQDTEISLPQVAGKKSLAVMYFENQTGGEELDWMREGLADMLITNLSRSDKINVLSRQQFQTLLEKTGYRQGDKISFEQTIQIAGKSRAENFITGSFAKVGEKIRIDAQLHDSADGSLLVTESLTVEKPEQILTGIDLLSLKLAKHLGAEEREHRANFADVMTDNLEAFRYYSLALEKAQGLHKKDALELLEKAVALDAEFAMAHARIGYIYAVTWGRAAEGKPHLEKAFALADRLTEKDRLNITAWYAIANLDYPSAIRAFREIIAGYPLETEAYLRLGYLLRGEEQFDEAISVMRQGLTIDPESAPLYNALGLLYSILGRHDEAIAMHERYVALAPDEPNAQDSLGMSLQWAGRYEEAIAAYDRALQLNPSFEIAHVHLGVAYFQTGRYQTAIEQFKKYIAVAPSKLESGRGYSYIAHVYRKLKNYEAAAQAAKKASEENEYYVFEAYFTASERGDRAPAQRFEQRLFAGSNNSNRGMRNTSRIDFYHRGYVALKNGQPDEALENFRESLRHSPATWDIDSLEDCLANAYLELGKFDEAAAEYERILRLNPNYPLARFYLAQAFERKGQITEARENYRLFLENSKNADANIPQIISAKKYINGF